MGRVKANDVQEAQENGATAPAEAVEVEAKVVGEPQDFIDRLNHDDLPDDEFLALPLWRQWEVFKEWLMVHLVEDIHYGRAIDAARVRTLLQAGAEQICAITGTVPQTEMDSTPMTMPFFARGDFVTLTRLECPSKPLPGIPIPVSIRGATIEMWGLGNEAIDRNGNIGVQKAAKRSFVNAVKRLYNLSDLFVLEAEGMKEPAEAEGHPQHDGRPAHHPDTTKPEDVEWAQDGKQRYPVLPATYKVVKGDEPSRRIMQATWDIAKNAGVKWSHRYASYLIHLAGSFVATKDMKGRPLRKPLLKEPLYTAKGDLRNVSPRWRTNIADALEACVQEQSVATLLEEMNVKKAQLEEGTAPPAEEPAPSGMDAAQREVDEMDDLPF